MGVAMARLPSVAVHTSELLPDSFRIVRFFAGRTLLAAALSFAAGLASADSHQDTRPDETTEVIVEGTRLQVEQRVHAFVSEITRRGYGKESLVRWRKPICPLVAGLTREQGEFILYGVTQAAAAAGAPLDAKECQ